MLMRVETTFRIFGYPGLAMLCFLAAAAGGLWLVLSILLHDRAQGRRGARAQPKTPVVSDNQPVRITATLMLGAALAVSAQAPRQSPRVRARELGHHGWHVSPGPNNAITDVDGVLVGHATIVRGEGALKVGAARCAPASPRCCPARTSGSRRLRRHLHAERRRRDDRHALDPRPRDAGASDAHHQHRQHRRRARRRHRLHDRAAPQARLGLPAGRGRNLGRHAQRHPRPSCPEGARLRGARRRDGRSRGRRQRRRRHRHDLLQLQGRHRHRVAPAVRPTAAATPSACWCRPTSAGASSCDRRRAGGPRDSPSGSPDIKSNAGIDDNHEGSVIVVVATDAPLSSRQLERAGAARRRSAWRAPAPRRATAAATSSWRSRRQRGAA